MAHSTPTGHRAYFIIAALLGFVAFDLYLWRQVDPCLVYHLQKPAFLTGGAFFMSFLDQPGGWLQYASAFLSQACAIPWAGALVVTGLAVVITLTTRLFLRAMGGTAVEVVHLVPALLLLVLHNQYTHPLTPAVGLALATLVLAGYVRWRIARPIGRVIVLVLLTAALYYALAGVAMILVVGTAAYAWCRDRRAEAVAGAVSGGLIPFAVGTLVFGLAPMHAYTRLLALDPAISPGVVAIALYAFYPVAALAIGLRRRSPSVPVPPRAADTFVGRAIRQPVAQLVVFLAIGAGAATATAQPKARSQLMLSLQAEMNDDARVLGIAESMPAHWYTPLVHFNVNRALYHAGRIPDDLFAFPQSPDSVICAFDESALLRLSHEARLHLSDIYFELGGVAEAEHGAQEAIENMGPHPGILERLVKVYIVKQAPDTAAIFVNAMAGHLLWRDRADGYRALLEPGAEAPPWAQSIRAIMPVEDYLGPRPVYDTLTRLLERNPANRMVFEYLMAYCLVQRNLEGVVENLDHLEPLGYDHLPRTYEQALLLREHLAHREAVDVAPYAIRPEARERFNAFITRYNARIDDRSACLSELRGDFGKTYYFYYMFGDTD